MMAAASRGPRRRTSEGTASACDARFGVGLRATKSVMALLRDQLAREVVPRQLHPLRRALFRKNHDAHVDELAVLQHLGARLRGIARVSDFRLHPDHIGLVALSEF